MTREFKPTLQHGRNRIPIRASHPQAPQISDAGLIHLKGLTQLHELDLSGTQIDGTGFIHLRSLTQLHELNLSGTRISNERIVHCGEMTQLKTLHLKNTKLSDASIKDLKEALPKCEIRR